ncbi:zinc finger domain-containing protein [Rhodococcus koreensis]|uniref:zinc finger domain-containing protein n=1 Tax=Rhodococcus koreensis TaxID=99653 RepID=UPI0036D9510C
MTTDPIAARLARIVLTVPCPTCNAPEGARCTIRGRRKFAHMSRQDAAVRAANLRLRAALS